MARISYCALDGRFFWQADGAGVRNFLQPSRNIHAIAKEIAIRFDYDIADVDSHAQADCRRPIRDLTIAQAVLDLQR
jgi:hypothetical protein